LSGPREPRNPFGGDDPLEPEEPWEPFEPRRPDDRYEPRGWDDSEASQPDEPQGPDEPYDGWPERDLELQRAGEEPAEPPEEVTSETSEEPLAAERIPLRTGEQGWDTRQFGERRKPTTAEQAVP